MSTPGPGAWERVPMLIVQIVRTTVDDPDSRKTGTQPSTSTAILTKTWSTFI